MTALFEFQDVHYHYPGQERSALKGCSVAIPPGEKVAEVGRNGAGKSTLFLHCNGLYRPESGKVYFKGRPIIYSRKALKQLRQQVGMIFQHPDDQLFSASVAQDISFGPLNLGCDETKVRQQVQNAAQLCEIEHLLEQPTHALSGGEKARVALAGVLAMQPEVLVADELMSSLDPWVRLAIFDILQRLHDQGKTIIMATHDLSVVRYWATFVIVMQAGRVVFADTPKRLLTNTDVMKETELDRVWWEIDLDFKN